LTIRQKIILLLTLLVVAVGVTAWIYHSHEIQLREKETVEAQEQHAKSVVAGLKSSFDADDEWEDTFSSSGVSQSPYTFDLEKALIRKRLVIVYGIVEDVRKADDWRSNASDPSDSGAPGTGDGLGVGEPEKSVVSVLTQTRTRGLDLRMSLLAPPSVTSDLLSRPLRSYGTIAFVVKINSIEKVSPPSSTSGDEYFLAHGTVYESQPIGLHRPPHK